MPAPVEKPSEERAERLSDQTYKASTEVGKAEEMINFCEYLASRNVQREVHEGLNVV